MKNNNSTSCDFLDKYGVATGARGKQEITLEDGTVTTEAQLCTEHCPYDEECILVVKDRKKK